MQAIEYRDDRYVTPQHVPTYFSRTFPTSLFYLRLTWIVFRSAALARLGKYDGQAWIESSLRVKRWLELAGVEIEITGVSYIEKVGRPVVFIGNHMSMMETMVLPGIIRPIQPVTYVVKESLLDYPVFKHIMRSRKPIGVTRTNPRQDLKIVMREGVEKLINGVSIIVFPQTTRTTRFDPAQMSSIGVKLAKKAGVPVIPFALRTDCWQNGSFSKDFGRINPDRRAHFAFGAPLEVEGKGDQEQQRINSFIQDKLREWEAE